MHDAIITSFFLRQNERIAIPCFGQVFIEKAKGMPD
jgi:hypothetical protein